MALKDLLVYLDSRTDHAPGRLRLGADLARRHHACLTALYVREWSPAQLAHHQTAELAGRPLSEVEALDRAVENSIDQSALEMQSALEQLGAQYGIDTEWRMVDGEPLTVLPQHARYADLCILGAQSHAVSTSAGYRFSEGMLFTAGRPVLLVPEAETSTVLGAHMAVAWNSSRACARALNDALPLLEHCQKTTVIAINPGDYIDLHGALPLPRLLEHLKRHGILAQVIELAAVPTAEIANVLQENALAAGADMVVAGAHGHTWLREVLLGSVTRELLSHLRLPVMLSH